MKQYQEMTREELRAEHGRLAQSYSRLQAKGLKLNMARGKPGADQLELSLPLLDGLNSKTATTPAVWTAATTASCWASRRRASSSPTTWASPPRRPS